MSRRSRAREVALQILYRDDVRAPVDDQAGEAPRTREEDEQFLRARLGQRPELIEFARGLIDGVRQHSAEIDQLLKEHASNWSLNRIAKTDRNALRLGCYELVYGDTPAPVAINESIELAKRYGTAESGRFVNGMLDRIWETTQVSNGDRPTESETSGK